MNNSIQMYTRHLASAPSHRFADWPNRAIPQVCAGVYTVHDRQGEFLYVGMAGAGLTEAVAQRKLAARKRSGLYDRLNSHASGYRSGDRFNIYIGDLYVLGTLSPKAVANIATRTASFDAFIKEFIRSELSYQYVIVPNTVVRELEVHIQVNGIKGRLPVINSRS